MKLFIFKNQFIFSLFLAVCVLLNVFGAIPSFAEEYALLVGCTRYEHLIQDHWLEGPANDVAMMAELLTTEMFHFKPENVFTLAGWPADEMQRPTRANIERAFKRLAEVARQGDQIVILLAGHGSQQPADDDPNDLEPDGLDEIFLPADVKEWNFDIGSVENAIIDDELRVWLTAIRNTGAFVWLIADACHSGTFIRDKTNVQVRERYLAPDVLIPQAVLQAAAQRAAQAPKARGAQTLNILGLAPDAGDIVALYAAQSTETTPEMRLPHPLIDPFRGIFSYTLATVLRQSPSPLTYRELVERINTQYRSQGRSQPTPLIEGGALDREVLGLKAWPNRPKILLGAEDPNHPGQYELKMGSLHGLHVGDVLAMYPPAGEQNVDKLIGHLKITTLLPLSAFVTPVVFDQVPAPSKEQLRPSSRGEVAFVNYGDLRLKIAVQRQIDAGGAPEVHTYLPNEGPANIEAALATLLRERQMSNLVTRVPTAAEADWLLRIVNEQLRLLPVSGVGSEDVETPQFRMGVLTQSPETLVQALRSALTRIVKATTLMNLAGEGSAGRVAVQVELLRFKDKRDRTGALVPYETAGRILRPGDIIAFQVTNPTDVTLDVSLLFIDSGYGITAFFPEPGIRDDNRLTPGKSIVTPKAEITGDTFGLEQLVTIAVKASQERIDFACLEQPTLDRARGGDRGKRAMESPLGQLLEAALYGEFEGDREDRGMRKLDLDNYALLLLTWRTVPSTE